MDAILMQVTLQAGIACLFSFALGIVLTMFVYGMIARARARQRAEDAERQVEGAKREADNIIKSAQIEAASEAIKKKEQFTNEANQIRSELRENEMRLSKREDALDRQTDLLQKQEAALKKQEQECERRLRNTELKDKQLSVLIAQQKNQLLKITAMDIEEARQLLLKRLEDECEHEMSALIQRKVEEAEELADGKSREILSTAIQRYAAEQTCEVTVSTVDIPNDDMKGRIIGREGRNIRAFEKATGVDVIVDDTPGMVVVSGFNPVRREVARLSMERLIQDGRIHPSRIEELVAQTRNDVNAKVLQLGKDAAVETNVRGLSNKIISLLGSLAYRTSYGQNVLRHSVEVAFLSQVMADELGLDGSIARRAGLLHDIGKAARSRHRGQPPHHRNQLSQAVQRIVGRPQRGGRPSWRYPPGQSVYAPRGGRRRHQRLATGCPKGNARTLHQATGEARGDRHGLHGSRNGLCDPGRARDSRHCRRQ